MQFTNFSMVTDMYKIAYLNDDGEWQSLAEFDTYAEADEQLDKYCNRYQNAWIEILPQKM